MEKCYFPTRLHPTILQSFQIPYDGFNLSLDTAQEYFGIWSVFITPPPRLFTPVLPYVVGAKTIYGLCRTVI
jgi:hypothetical protein